MLTYGSELQKRTAQESFWNRFWGSTDPYEGIYATRTSTQKTDTLTRLGAAPMPRVWDGDRQAKSVPELYFNVTNKAYEATVRVDKELIKYQQWDEIANLIGGLGAKARLLRAKLITDLAEAGFAAGGEGDDGQYFFDDDHADPGAAYTTAQDNDLTSAAATGTQPTDLEMATGIRNCFNALYGFKDSEGDPVGIVEAQSNFVAVVPPAYRSVAMQVMKNNQLTGPIGNDLQDTFTVRVDQRLANADRFFFYYIGGPHRPYIVNEVQSPTGGAMGVRLVDYLEPHSGHTIYSAEWDGTAAYGQWRCAIGYIYT